MFLLLNSFVASLDGLLIGIGLKLSKIHLSKANILTIFIGNICIYSFFLTTYSLFQFTFITKTISTILYVILALNSLKEEKKEYKKNDFKLLECILVTLTHSLDGTIISLNFVYDYNLFHIVSIFSVMSILVLLIGYYFANFLKNIKHANFIGFLLFILLAVINQLF